MWNLLAQGNSSSLYRPTAYTDASSKAIGEEYAYDADSYPWATSATLTADSSGTANTPDNFDLIYTTFGTLGKANFSSALVQIALLEVSVNGQPGSYDNHAATAGLTISYSTNGGSTFTDAAYYIADALDTSTGHTYHSATAQTIYTTSSTLRCISPYWASSDVAFTVASSAFSTGLQDLQIRFRTSTIKSTGSPVYASSVRVLIANIQAMVS